MSRKKTNIFVRLLRTVNVFFAMLLLLSYMAYHLPPDPFWIVGFLGLAYPILVLVNIIFVAFWMMLKNKLLLISVFALLLGYNHFVRHFQISFPIQKEEKSISILTYNIQGSQGSSAKKKFTQVNSFLDSLQPDIICLQEVHSVETNLFIKAQKGKYHLLDSDKQDGLLVLSKYPSIGHHSIQTNENTFATFFDIVINNDTIRLFNTQLASNHLQEEKTIFDESSDWKSEDAKQKVKGLAKKLIVGYENRVQEVTLLEKALLNSPYANFICGDFNDTPLSYTYHKLIANEMSDSFTREGFGMSNTHNENLPPIRIDYILHSNRYKTLKYKCLKVNYSDHFPIIAEISPLTH